jgi:NAD(P)-dependent dehydrogenase (short-subunit alcohol dehydrogenase family)
MGSRSLDKARAAIDALRADADFAQAFAGGSEVMAVQLDVDDDESIAALAKQLETSYGRLDVLVHNAGP